MLFKYDKDLHGTYGGLAIGPEEFRDADVIIQGVPFECATSGKKGTSFAINALREICRDFF